MGVLLVAGLGVSCSASAPRDMWLGTDAGAGFEVPVRDTGSDTTDTGDTVGGEDAGAGAGGQGGAGGQAGAGGAGGDADASTDG